MILFIALILTVYFLWSLVFINFFALAFNWEDFLIYLVVAVVIYFIFRLIGGSLNNKFNKSVNEFLEGKKQDLFSDKGLLRTFGFLLITLLPFLFYMLLFALYAAIVFSLYVFVAVSNLPRVPVALLIGLAIVALGSAYATIVGFYYFFFPPRRKTLGIEVSKNEQAKLWELVNQISSEIKAKPIDRIIITPDSGIGVYLHGSLFSALRGGGSRTLEIGLPSLHNLTSSEFKSILAHEYGHFSNRDTQWGSFTFAMGNSLLSTLRATPGPVKGENQGFATLVMALNPAYWSLLIYINLYFKITSGFQRIREVMADIRAMDLYGGESFGNGLLKVATNDLLFSEAVQNRYVPQLLQEGKTISNFAKIMDFVYSNFKSDGIKELQNKLLESSTTNSIYDSHPALTTRINYSKKFDSKKQDAKTPVQNLFDDWDEINKKTAELYNVRLITYLQVLAKANAKAELKSKK